MTQVRLESVGSQRDSLQKIAELIRRGSVHPEILKAAKILTRDCDARDDECELEAIFNAVKNGDSRVSWLKGGIRYVSDPRAYDTFYTAGAMIDSCKSGACAADCLPYDTLVLRHDYRIVPLDEIRAGDVIMGDGVWTAVMNRWDKGEKDLIAIRLNNGSILRVTPDHRLFRVPRVNKLGNVCTSGELSGPRNRAEEVRAGEIRPGDDLLTIEQIPFGAESIDPDRAWLLGAYIADGWAQPHRASIAGKDGHPKEEQKRRVREIAARFGWETYWHDRYISINDEEVTAWLSACGKRAPQKHVPSGLNYNESTIRAILSGLLADAFVREDGTITHGTTSPLLAAQLRVMYRMLGQSTSVRRIDDHGGLGSNPIYRITPRKKITATGRAAKAYARVKSIEETRAAPVMDLETDTGRFYLPETDLIVHNCDDMTVIIGSMAAALGFKVGARAWGPSRSQTDDYQHVYAVAAVPKNGPWPKDYFGTAMDPTVKKSYLGWEPDGGHILTAWIE